MSENTVAAGQLRSIIERIERVRVEIAEAQQVERDIFAEAKGNGFDVKIIKEVLKARAQDEHLRAEHGALFNLYMEAAR